MQRKLKSMMHKRQLSRDRSHIHFKIVCFIHSTLPTSQHSTFASYRLSKRPGLLVLHHTSNRNHKLVISTVPRKVKSREPAYSQALIQNKIDRQQGRSRESGRQTIARLWWMVF